MKLFFAPVSAAHQKKEKVKARELRSSSWWKQQVGPGICYHCEGHFPQTEMTMDHLIPIARGGKSDKKNCVTSCNSCNNKKGHKTRAELAFDELAGQQVPDPSAESEDDNT